VKGINAKSPWGISRPHSRQKLRKKVGGGNKGKILNAVTGPGNLMQPAVQNRKMTLEHGRRMGGKEKNTTVPANPKGRKNKGNIRHKENGSKKKKAEKT